MIFFSLLFALLLEHLRPLGVRIGSFWLFLSYADSLERYFNTGIRRHGIAAWFAAVAPVLYSRFGSTTYCIASIHCWDGYGMWSCFISLWVLVSSRIHSLKSRPRSRMATCLLPVRLLREFYGVHADDLEQPGNSADRHRTGTDQFASLRFCDNCLLCDFAGSVGPGSLSACRVVERTVG